MRSPSTARKSSPLSPQLEKARAQQRRPNAAKNKIKLRKKEKEEEISQTNPNAALYGFKTCIGFLKFI